MFTPRVRRKLRAYSQKLHLHSETGWHLHPAPSFAFVLEGALAVQLKDGQIKKLKAGEAFAEVVDVLHNGRNKYRCRPSQVDFFMRAWSGKKFQSQKIQIKGCDHKK